MIPREKQGKLYAKVPGWWCQREIFWGLLVPKSPMFPYVSNLFINDSPRTEDLYRDTRADNCVMFTMVFFQWVDTTDDFIEISPVGLACE